MVVIVGQSAAHKNQYVTQSPRFNIYSKRFPGKQNVSTDNVFLNSQLFIQYPGDLFLPAISLPLLPRFAITCNCKSASKVKSASHSNGPLGKHMLSSASSKGHLCKF